MEFGLLSHPFFSRSQVRFPYFSDLLEAVEFCDCSLAIFQDCNVSGGFYSHPWFRRFSIPCSGGSRRIDFETGKITNNIYIAHIKSPSLFTCGHASTTCLGAHYERRIFMGLIQNQHNLGIVKTQLNLKSKFYKKFPKSCFFLSLMSIIFVVTFVGPKKPFNTRYIFPFDLIWVLKTQTYHLEFKRFSRTVAPLLIVVDPLLARSFLW